MRHATPSARRGAPVTGHTGAVFQPGSNGLDGLGGHGGPGAPGAPAVHGQAAGLERPGHRAAQPLQPLQQLRRQRRISQLELSLRVGVSQRHLSCVETGRARPSREMLHALLDALDAPLAERNQALLDAGYAPAYAQRALDDAQMAPVRDALAHLLAAHDPAPAFVLDDAWNLLQGNRGTAALLRLLGMPAAAQQGPLNFLQALLAPGGLAACLVDGAPVLAEVWQRAQREAAFSPALRAVVEGLRPSLPRGLARVTPASTAAPQTPLLLTTLRAVDGTVLRFFSAFTSFGAPLDVTAASLRVEHFFPADEATRQGLAQAVAEAAS